MITTMGTCIVPFKWIEDECGTIVGFGLVGSKMQFCPQIGFMGILFIRMFLFVANRLRECLVSARAIWVSFLI